MRTSTRLVRAALSLTLATTVCTSLAHADPTPGAGSGDCRAAGGSGAGAGSAVVAGSAPRSIDEAKATVRSRQVLADCLQAELAAADQQSHALAVRAGLAAEAHDAAVSRAAEGRRAAAEAQARYAAAREAQAAADSRLGALAADTYRQGPDLTRLLAFTNLTSLREYTDRAMALRKIGESEAGTVRDATTAAQAAQTAQQQAAAAAAAQEAAEQQARLARDAAASAAVSARGWLYHSTSSQL